VKIAALLLPAGLLIWAASSFTVRCEPTAALQTEVPIPFQIDVTDDRKQAVQNAKVTLHIETADHEHAKDFRASAISAGVYIAKPVFPVSGDWTVSVQAARNDRVGSQTAVFSVPKSLN
jgi:hypothetical protein